MHKEWPYRNQLLTWLKNTYKHRYTKYGHPERTVRDLELNQLYVNSDVVVGDSLCLGFNHPYYWSDRVYETLGRGGFIIHPYIKGMEEEFTDGENIVFYEYMDFPGLKSKIDYYLSHEEDRERIRYNGHEFVKRNATYHNRLTQMLDIIFPPLTDKEQRELADKINANPYLQAQPLPHVGDSDLRINLGAGNNQFEGWVNVDHIPLPGIDVVHNLMVFPYPFESGSGSEISVYDVLEHLDHYTDDKRPSVIAFIEECYRILKPGGKLFIQTPRYDADFLWIDPTHVRGFHEKSMDFFDPETEFGKSTGFYSDAKFSVLCETLPNKNLRFTMIKL